MNFRESQKLRALVVNIVVLLWVIAIAFLVAHLKEARADNQTIKGHVEYDQGGRVPGVEIQITLKRCLFSDVVSSQLTTDNGTFYFTGLKDKMYILEGIDERPVIPEQYLFDFKNNQIYSINNGKMEMYNNDTTKP